MKLTRRGFIEAIAMLPLGQAAEPNGVYPYLRRLMDRSAAGEVVINKGRAVGSTSANVEALQRSIEKLAALLRQDGKRQPRPDLIVIDGIGYGKDDPLPPPFGSGQ
jgi:hypothetical protein